MRQRERPHVMTIDVLRHVKRDIQYHPWRGLAALLILYDGSQGLMMG